MRLEGSAETSVMWDETWVGAEIGVDCRGRSAHCHPRGKDDRVWIGEPTDRLRRLPRVAVEGKAGDGREDWLKYVD